MDFYVYSMFRTSEINILILILIALPIQDRKVSATILLRTLYPDISRSPSCDICYGEDELVVFTRMFMFP
jgi:hypothetical protein